ncbi:MAG: HAMP domain-containing sensor histidine kinase [Bdellovibrionia bacterium]
MSKSRSKTPRISKNTAPATKRLIQPEIVIGHHSASPLAPQDEALFRAFQSNLLSLISHELRTPLTGILNALTALEDGETDGALSSGELVKMARQNAQRLHQALVALLDLASLESGTFHARLREVDLIRLVRRWIGTGEPLFKDRGLKAEVIYDESVAPAAVLADTQKLGRVIDLCFQIIAARAEVGSVVDIRISLNTVTLTCNLPEGLFKSWQAAWAESLTGLASGLSSPFSAFAGVLQSEQAFLSRSEEGLGSELLLIHEIMRLHQGKFDCLFDEGCFQVKMSIELPVLSSEEALRAVLTSRAYQVSSELGSVALVLIQVPDDVESNQFREEIRKNLFRTTDAVYPLPSLDRLALVLDDCKPEDAPILMARLSGALDRKLSFATAQCPSDVTDPAGLVAIAESRLLELC